MAPTQSAKVKSPRELVARFPRCKVLVVGDLVADHYIYGQTDRVSREAPVLIVRYESSEVKLGGGANVAANVRSLGGQVDAVGALGDDEMGRALRSLFHTSGITYRGLTSRGIQTETKTRILAGGVSTTRQQMLRLDRGDADRWPRRLRVQLAQRVEAAARDADVLVVSDYGAGAVQDEVREVVRGLGAKGLRVCVDSRHHLALFRGMSVCKPNEPELHSLTGRPVSTDTEVEEAAKAALDLLECEALVVTRGRRGMAVFRRDGARTVIPTHGAREAVDVTGAGDTVIAALALSLGAGAKVELAARLANVAGACVVQKQGTATVSASELKQEL